MFGYIRVFKPDLRICEYETYRAVYCSLCKEMGKGFGPLARLTLSYDFTFLALLCLALGETMPTFRNARCSFNPLVKCHVTDNSAPALRFSASAAMIMQYYKVLDDMRDHGLLPGLRARFLFPLAARAFRRAAGQFPMVADIVGKMAQGQMAVEASDVVTLDAASNPTAEALSDLLKMCSGDPDVQRILGHLGYCMGKWIYLMDAVDDFAEDMAKDNFNPLQAAYHLLPSDTATAEAARREAQATMNVCLAQASSAYELLPIVRYGTILSNILYLGMPETMKQVLAKETGV